MKLSICGNFEVYLIASHILGNLGPLFRHIYISSSIRLSARWLGSIDYGALSRNLYISSIQKKIDLTMSVCM